MKAIINEEPEISKLMTVMGYIAVKEVEGISEKVKILNSLGFSNKQMALICNSSESSIAVFKTLSKNKKKKKQK